MPAPERNQALAAGLTAYLLWGFIALYLAALKPAGALEILAQRVVWSFLLVLAVLLVLRGGWSWLRTQIFTRHAFPRLLAAATLVGANWLIYIWAINNHHVVEASLGYFINPLVNVVLGVVLFRERLGVGGRIGGSVALAGVVIISAGHLAGLWVSLALALSFGLYGAVKKASPLTGLQGLLIESALLAPLALLWLGWLGAQGTGHFGVDPLLTALLIGSGLITALPLWLFAIAAPRLPFGVLGILQYVAPTIQFLLGITFFGERVSPTYWAGLGCVWVGSAIYLAMTLRRREPVSAGRPDAPAPAR